MTRLPYDPHQPLPIAAVADLHLHEGGHADRSNGLCAMEVVAWLAGEPHSDAPVCASAPIAAFMRSWNDTLRDEDRDRLLKPLLPRLLHTRSTPEVEDRRAWLAFDWLVREFAPEWLVIVADLEPESAARSAARSAAWSAARSAARSAAESVLQPTKRALQDSALQLVERMLAVTPDSVAADGLTARVVGDSQ